MRLANLFATLSIFSCCCSCNSNNYRSEQPRNSEEVIDKCFKIAFGADDRMSYSERVDFVKKIGCDEQIRESDSVCVVFGEGKREWDLIIGNDLYNPRAVFRIDREKFLDYSLCAR